MNAEFNWWLLIVGLVVGAGLVWLVVTDSARRDADVDERERADEALWIATTMHEAGHQIDDRRVVEVLRLHRDYLAAPPPDDPPAAGVTRPDQAHPAVPRATARPGAAPPATTPPSGPVEPDEAATAFRR